MPSSKRSLPMWASLLIAGAAGVLVAVQTRLNGGLSRAIDDGYITAAFSFGAGLVVLVIALACSRGARQGLRMVGTELRARRLPVWTLTGGLCGAFFVVGQGLVATILGVALFTVGVVAGQVLGGLVMDRIGVGPGGRVDPTLTRVIGSVLAIAAVLVSVVADLVGGHDLLIKLWLVVVPILAGIGTAWQVAVNGLLRVAAHNVTAATFISFAVGMVLLVIAAAISIAVNGWPTEWPSNPLLYLGGPLGVLFVAMSAWLVRRAGVLLVGMASVAGQLVGSAVVEAVLPLAGGVTAWLLAGTVLALVAVTIAALPSRAQRPTV